jgi:8-oxo-dGTP pyrophosphatase MutT (NUDIX family)
MTPAQRIALWADKLRDISAMGLMFSCNVHDRESYQRIQDIAIEMLALATGEPLEQLEPLRASIFARPAAIPTGDAAIINDDGRILLVQRADNGEWAMPGGATEVGETAAEAVVREALEETGVLCEPFALVGVYDSRLCGTVSRHHLYQFVFLCKPLNGGQAVRAPSHAIEVLDAGWFAEVELPAELDPGHVLRIRDAFRAWRGDGPAYFDRQSPERDGEPRLPGQGDS